MTKKFIKQEKKALKKEWKNILFNTIFATLTVLFTALFYKNIWLTTIIISIVSVIGLIKWKSWLTFTIFIFGALWGPLCEIISIKFGVWQYAIPNMINIPIWLFFVWGNAAAFLFETGKEIHKLGVKK